MINYVNNFSVRFVFVIMSCSFLNGCAISGSGNPTSSNHQRSEIGYIDEEHNVIVNCREPRDKQSQHCVRQSILNGKIFRKG